MNLHQRLPPESNWMWRLATEPKILDIMEHMLGPDIVLFSTQLATKRPLDGKDVPMHQVGDIGDIIPLKPKIEWRTPEQPTQPCMFQGGGSPLKD